MSAKEEGRGFREYGKKSVRGIEEREGWREEEERAREEK